MPCVWLKICQQPVSIMMFPDAWASQTRPLDPDTCSVRKRRNKSKPVRQSPADTEENENPPKRSCVEDTAVQRKKPVDSATEDTVVQRKKPVDSATEDPPVPIVQHKKAVIPKSDIPPNPKPVLENYNPVNVSVSSGQQVPVVLEVFSLISRLPYAQMLNQVFTDDVSNTEVIPVVTKSYEESFLREPMHAGERPCVCGDSCECNFIDPSMPFIGVEFTMGTTSETPQMCVLCSRRLTQELFFSMVYSGQRFRGVIQRWGNICNQPMEYAREAMLICPQNGLMQNMPLPMVAHQRHRYSVYSQNGTRFLRQHKVGYQDFH
jgi:hypothetical protein